LTGPIRRVLITGMTGAGVSFWPASIQSSTSSRLVCSWRELSVETPALPSSRTEIVSNSRPLLASRTTTLRILRRPSSWTQPSITASTPACFAARDHCAGPWVCCDAAARACSQRLVATTSYWAPSTDRTELRPLSAS
jgi:hypothetical protein